MLIVLIIIGIYDSTPLNKWSEEDHWSGMEQIAYCLKNNQSLKHLNEVLRKVRNQQLLGHQMSMILGRWLRLPMGMLLKAVSLCVQYPCECNVTAMHEIPGSKKNQKSVGFESPVSSDP